MIDGLSTSVALKAPVVGVESSNITLAGLQGYTEGDRVLCIGQTDTTENGIYDANSGAWTRSKDCDGNRDLVRGTLIVTDGGSTPLLFFRVTSPNPIVIGTSAITIAPASEVQNPYPLTLAEIAADVVPVDYDRRTEPYDMRRYGVAFDSNGASGHGTDSTTAIRNALKVAKQFGDKLTAPPGRARYTAPISEFVDAVLSTNPSLHGDSRYNTIFFGDFTVAGPTYRAGFEIDNDPGNRMYWSLKNFRMEGPGGDFGACIYSNYGSFLTEFENLFLKDSHNGLVIANNYELSLKTIDAVCENNGIQIGFELDGVTEGRCNVIGIYGGNTTLCGANGVYVFGGLNISAHGSASEGNGHTNYYFDTCEGVVLDGVYIETAPGTAGSQTAQVYCLDCKGVVIDGVTVSAFKHGGEPIFLIEGCDGVSIKGITPRTTGGPYNAVGVRIKSSTNVVIDTSVISDCATSIVVTADSASQVEIRNVTMINYTNTVSCLGAVAHKIRWDQVTSAYLAAASFNAANAVDLQFTDLTKNCINQTKVFKVAVTFAELNAGGKNIITAQLPGESWEVMDILAYTSTQFDAGGDKTVKIWDPDTNIVYTTIPNAALEGATFSAKWGHANVPIPVTADIITPTGAGRALKAQYASGAANHAAGVINLKVLAMRVA